MDKLLLPKTEVSKLVKSLQERFSVIAPVERKGQKVVFRRLESYEDPYLDLDYTLSILPPQKIGILPCWQELFGFKVESPNLLSETEGREQVVLFGVQITDLLALKRLDKIMESPVKDVPYWKVRERVIIMGVDYPAHPKAFQPPIEAKEGLFDLFLDDVGEDYQILIGSDKGRDVIGRIPLRRTAESPEKGPPLVDPILADVEKLKSAVELSKDSKLWDEMAELCIGCGICTWVCPLCYCFDVCDKINIRGEGSRERVWDSCLLRDFARIGNDINFRESLRERFYNWYYHKFVRMPEEYGFLGCTGCGRCSAYCPAGINIKKNLVRLVKELEEKT